MRAERRTEDQKFRALEVANRRRSDTAALKRELASGETTIAEAVFDGRTDRLMVGSFLGLHPHWGEATVRTILGRLATSTAGPHEVRLWPWARMGDLTHRQRSALRVCLATHSWTRKPRQPPKLEVVGPAYKAKTQREEWADVQTVVQWISAEFPGCAMPDIEQRLGLTDGTLRRWFRGESAQVKVSVLDRAFTSVGRPDLLNEVFPS